LLPWLYFPIKIIVDQRMQQITSTSSTSSSNITVLFIPTCVLCMAFLLDSETNNEPISQHSLALCLYDGICNVSLGCVWAEQLFSSPCIFGPAWKASRCTNIVQKKHSNSPSLSRLELPASPIPDSKLIHFKNFRINNVS
jgi:hypothetical protein